MEDTQPRVVSSLQVTLRHAHTPAGLSNGLLDEWDKVTGGVQLMSELLGVPCPTNTTTATATSDNNGYSEDCGRISGTYNCRLVMRRDLSLHVVARPHQ